MLEILLSGIIVLIACVCVVGFAYDAGARHERKHQEQKKWEEKMSELENYTRELKYKDSFKD